jgi:hypothetical protein
MILMKTGMHYEPAAIYLVCVLYGPSRPVCPTNIRRSHAADEGQLWVESGGRASLTVYCASVSPSMRCVSPIVRQRLRPLIRLVPCRTVRRREPGHSHCVDFVVHWCIGGPTDHVVIQSHAAAQGFRI